MKIAIIGTGRVGSVLGKRWGEARHEVVFGVPDPSDTKASSRVLGVKEAVQWGDYVLLAIPWQAAESVIKESGNWQGKIILDCINPIEAGFKGLSIGRVDSAAEKVAAWAQGALVVKAFNCVGSDVMAEPKVANQPSTLFICGEDANAKKMVSKLGEDLGFEVCDCGGLPMARYLEPIGMLLTLLMVKQGLSAKTALKLLTE